MGLEKNKIDYQVSRLDILYGTPLIPTLFPCEKCNSESCEGKGECKKFGAYRLCVRIK